MGERNDTIAIFHPMLEFEVLTLCAIFIEHKHLYLHFKNSKKSEIKILIKPDE